MKTAAAAAAESPGDGAPVASRLTAIEVCAIVVAVLAVIAAAKVAQPLLVPVVAAILLSYTLRPLVSGLERLAVPRVACAAIVVPSRWRTYAAAAVPWPRAGHAAQASASANAPTTVARAVIARYSFLQALVPLGGRGRDGQPSFDRSSW